MGLTGRHFATSARTANPTQRHRGDRARSRSPNPVPPPRQNSGSAHDPAHSGGRSSGPARASPLHPRRSSGSAHDHAHSGGRSSGSAQASPLHTRRSSGSAQASPLHTRRSSGPARASPLHPRRSSGSAHGTAHSRPHQDRRMHSRTEPGPEAIRTETPPTLRVVPSERGLRFPMHGHECRDRLCFCATDCMPIIWWNGLQRTPFAACRRKYAGGDGYCGYSKNMVVDGDSW
jgi:hypothetical protein